MQEEDVTEIPLVYPLVSVTLKSVSIVDGKRVLHECEEVIDFTNTYGALVKMSKLGKEFKGYVKKVIAAADTPQARDAYQRILDNLPPDQSPTTEGRPSSSTGPVTGAGEGPGTAPSTPPAELPDSAAS